MRKPYFNVLLDVVDKSTALKMCFDAFTGNGCKSLFFVNAHCFNIAQTNAEYRKVLNNSDLIFNDGIGLKLASYFTNIKFKDNLNGTDFIPEIIELGFLHNKKIYLVGGKEGVAAKARSVLERKHKNILIVGANSGFFSDTEEKIIINDINNTRADILIVGMGVPKQELWINKIKNDLKTIKICVAGGAVIDFIAGNIKRAPKWMRANNIEWMYRLYLEPRRMWKRYLIGNFRFFYNICKNLMKARWKMKLFT